MRFMMTVGVIAAMLVVCAWAWTACGSGLPAEVEEARQEAVQAADEQFEEASDAVDAEYASAVATAEARFEDAKAYADKAVTSEAKQLRIREAEEARDSAIQQAKRAKVERIEEAERARIERKEEAAKRAELEAIHAESVALYAEYRAIKDERREALAALDERFMEEGGAELAAATEEALDEYSVAVREYKTAFDEIHVPLWEEAKMLTIKLNQVINYGKEEIETARARFDEIEEFGYGFSMCYLQPNIDSGDCRNDAQVAYVESRIPEGLVEGKESTLALRESADQAFADASMAFRELHADEYAAIEADYNESIAAIEESMAAIEESIAALEE